MNNNLLLDEVFIPDDLHIFLLEDTRLYQAKMHADLKALGFRGRLTVAASLEQAAAKFKEDKADFYLVDWNLPDGIGLDFLRLIRADKAFDNIPVLMVTALSDIDNILDATKDGADGYIVKPWDQKELTEKIAFAYKTRKK